MWVFCAGSKRSGSTLQYNIVSRIIELKEEGIRLPHSKPEDFNQVYTKYEDYKGYKVFKTHLLTDNIKSCIESFEDVKIIYCYRDVRDVNVSLIKKGWIDRTLISLRNSTAQYIKDFRDWMLLKDVMYRSRYEDFYGDITMEIKGIAQYLNIVLSDDDVLQIATELGVDTIEKSNNELEQMGKYTFDSKTLLHKGHIQGRVAGQYQSFLTKEEIATIESEAYDWLQEYDYTLNGMDSDHFISYSQHADDYIAWQFLGKKSKGTVLEIGAFDGQHLSNSKSLEALGWKAINVEPNPVIFEYLKRNRPESINLNMAVVGDDAIKEIDFYAEELGVLSGCIVDEDDLKKRYKNRGIEYQEPQKIKVPAKTLNQILEDHEIEEVDVMSIDVEGFELEVLKGLDLNKAKINLLIIEANNEIIKKQIIDFFQPFKEFTYAGNNYQNLFFIRTKFLSRKIVKNLDFQNYIKAKQIHPKGEVLTLNSISPAFSGSKEFLKFKKIFGIF